MASSRPSSAPFFVSESEAYPVYDTDNRLVPVRGADQFLGHQASSHDGQSTLGPRGNRVQSGQIPRTQSVPPGRPTAVDPLGKHKSLNG